jgi:hypothetical protein
MNQVAKQLTVSLTASAIASILATLFGRYLLRRVIGSTEGGGESGEGERRPGNVSVNVMVFVVPVAVGNVMAVGAPGVLRYLLMHRRRGKRGK